MEGLFGLISFKAYGDRRVKRWKGEKEKSERVKR